MNTELRRNTKNDFGNSFFKLMNYPVLKKLWLWEIWRHQAYN